MEIKIKAEKFSKYPVWNLYNERGEYVNFYDRKATLNGVEYSGLTYHELIEILEKKGYIILNKKFCHNKKGNQCVKF